MTDAPPTTSSRRKEQAFVRWGRQDDFTARYEEYLDTVYGACEDPQFCGRRLLAAEIGSEIASRNARRVLDCAAGTGFPALDLAAVPPIKDFVIHCTDNDRPMLSILADRIATTYGPEHGVQLLQLAPEMSFRPRTVDIERLFLDWADLGKIGRPYDYVMCRGNSLVYASSWAGGKTVASPDKIVSLLRSITEKVKVGGYLHIDAPRHLDERDQEFTTRTSADGETTIWERVRTEAEYRHWLLSFKSAAAAVKFQRFSTLLTIDDVGRALKSMGFSDTKTREIEHERPGFGVIIARKNR